MRLSVHPDNAGAIAFYLKNEWEQTNTGEMHKTLEDCGARKSVRMSGLEIQRIRCEQQRRRYEVSPMFYSLARPQSQFLYFQILRNVITSLARRKRFPLEGLRIADIGCGTGGWLLEFCQWGGESGNLCGIDLDPDRIAEARRRLANVDLVCGSAEVLPWADATIDVVCQATLMTSILDLGLKRRVASEMLRVLKPGGLIMWYDLRVDNPRNPSVRGIGAREIRELFPNCAISLRSVTLAPPIARAVVPLSWVTALILEKVPLLRSHYLAIISKNPQ